jgi:hypothetical protein
MARPLLPELIKAIRIISRGIRFARLYKVILHSLHLTIGTLPSRASLGRERGTLTDLSLQCSTSERPQPPVRLGMYTLRALPDTPLASAWSWRFFLSSRRRAGISCRLHKTQPLFSHRDRLHAVFSERRCRGPHLLIAGCRLRSALFRTGRIAPARCQGCILLVPISLGQSVLCHFSSTTPHQPSSSVVASGNFVCSRAPSTIPLINAERMWRSS